MYTLEKYEWDQIWWNDTGDKKNPRVLLVGDSISVGYRDYVNSILKNKVNADVISTSKAVDNPKFTDTIDAVTDQSVSPISLIHFNNGLHGFHLSADDYIKYYEKILLHIMKKFPNAKIVLALSTPVTLVGEKEKHDPELNAKVIERNNMVRKLAEKYGLAVNDLYSLIDGKTYARKQDAYHYYSTGYKIMAKQIAELIEKELGL